MDRLTIFRKGLLLIAVPLCFQLLFLGLVATIRRANNDATRWTIHSNEVIAQAESCGYRILSAHGAVQGYFITRDPSFGGEFRRLMADSRAKLEVLVDLVADDPAQAAAARRVREKGVALLAYVEEGANMIGGAGMSPALGSQRRLRSQRMLEDLSETMGRFVADEKTRNTVRRVQLESAWRRLDSILVGGLVASILSSLLIASLYSRSVSGRIETLSENAVLLGEGRDLVPPLGGADEISRLDAAFRAMAATLATALRHERENAELASRRAGELDETNAQLREKARENEMFVYSVSHDLRSPLVNLQGFSKELALIGGDIRRAVDRDGVPDAVRAEAKKLVDVEMGESVGFIQSAVTRLSGIIDALLRLSRAGRVEYHPRPVEAGPMVARVVAALRGTIDDRGARVVVADLPAAHADPTALEQIFANLIGNAVNYLDPARPGLVEVSGRADAEPGGRPGVVYAVADNGLGIAEAYHGKIFTAFQRLHGDVARGEGIGLALVRRIAERNGGRVWFESAAGRGSTFFVAMPSGPAPPAGESREEAG